MANADFSIKRLLWLSKLEVKFVPKLKLVKRQRAYNSKTRSSFLQPCFSPIHASIPSGFSEQTSPFRPVRLNFDCDSDNERTSVPSPSLTLEEVSKIAISAAEVDYLCRNLPRPPPGFKYSDLPIFRSCKRLHQALIH